MYAIAIDPENSNILVADSSNMVKVFTSTGVYISRFGAGGSDNGQLLAPVGIAIHPATRAAVIADQLNNRIQIFAVSGSAAVARVVEFYNQILDNYFITANASEQAAIDNGSAGPGWSRTGTSFRSGGSTLVCASTEASRQDQTPTSTQSAPLSARR